MLQNFVSFRQSTVVIYSSTGLGVPASLLAPRSRSPILLSRMRPWGEPYVENFWMFVICMSKQGDAWENIVARQCYFWCWIDVIGIHNTMSLLFYDTIWLALRNIMDTESSEQIRQRFGGAARDRKRKSCGLKRHKWMSMGHVDFGDQNKNDHALLLSANHNLYNAWLLQIHKHKNQ